MRVVLPRGMYRFDTSDNGFLYPGSSSSLVFGLGYTNGGTGGGVGACFVLVVVFVVVLLFLFLLLLGVFVVKFESVGLMIPIHRPMSTVITNDAAMSNI